MNTNSESGQETVVPENAHAQLSAWQRLKARFETAHHQHPTRFIILFFIAGFAFDVLTLDRIDNAWSLLQQGFVLAILATLLCMEIIYEKSSPGLPRSFQKAWEWREVIIHFFFGSLLSSFTLFYFKSASLMTSFSFLGLLIVLLILNEHPRFQRSEKKIKWALLSLCLLSYFSYVVPIFIRYIGLIPFFISLTVATLSLFPLVRWLRTSQVPVTSIRQHVWLPHGVMTAIFLLCYLLKIIPPVPLSMNHMGIYHHVEKKGDQYVLQLERPWWRFWHESDQLFKAVPGERVYCFARIFSPTYFQDQIYFRWMTKEPGRGWVTADRVPMIIMGGRDEGFRGYTYKENYVPGKWRVQIETEDGREIGRLTFLIESETTRATKNRYTVTM